MPDLGCGQNYHRLESWLSMTAAQTGRMRSPCLRRARRASARLVNDYLRRWTGKTYVLHRADLQLAASGSGFSTPIRSTRRSPRVMMQYASTERAALVSLLPELRL